MKVRTYGFRMESPYPAVDLAKFVAYLESKNGAPDNRFENERRLYLNQSANPKYWLGLIVTVRDQKAFCKMQQESNGALIVSVENLKKTESVMDFNFFVIDKKTGIGLYQHYHQSCSVGRLAAYFQGHFKTLADEHVKDLIEKAKKQNPELTEKQIQKLAAKHDKGLFFTRITSNEKLDELLDEYKSLTAFEYEVETIADSAPTGVPIRKFAKRTRYKFVLSRGFMKGDVVKAITDTISEVNPTKGRAYVKDENDIAQAVSIFDMPESFDEYDYDVVAKTLDQLNLDQFEKCVALDWMIKVFSHPANAAYLSG